MSDTWAVASPPTLDPSISMHSRFSVADDEAPKQKRKRNDPAQAKDGQLKIGDYIEDQEVILPLSKLQWDNKREHAQMWLLDENEVKDKISELPRNLPGVAKIGIII